MRAMPHALRGFFAAVAVLWALLLLVAIGYSYRQGLPWTVPAAVAPAFLLESVFYLSAGVESVRARLGRIQPPWLLATWLAASGLAPFLVYTLLTGTFAWERLAVLTGFVLAASFWFVVLPRRRVTDLGFLALVACFLITRQAHQLYPSVVPRVALGVLGAVMWSRVGVLAVLLLRQLDNVRFSFLPTRREWVVGVQHFLLFLPLAVVLAGALEFARFRDVPPGAGRLVLTVVGTFAGMLWVQAVGEEVFCRGLLQQTLARSLGPLPGLVLASVLFGLGHLWFRNAFPNWDFVVLATLAGLFYGTAYTRTGSVRAAMVTHALVTTTWRVFFTA